MEYWKNTAGEVFRVTADGRAAYAAGISDLPQHKRRATPKDIERYEKQRKAVWDLVLQFLPLARTIAYKLMGRVDDVMVHDVGIPVIIRCTQLFDPSRGDFKPYVAQALKRRFIDYIRARNKRPTLELLDNIAIVDTALLELEETDLVSTIVAMLDPHDRLVIELHCFQGMTMQEVADVAGCAKSTISNAIKRIGREMRERLGL